MKRVTLQGTGIRKVQRYHSAKEIRTQLKIWREKKDGWEVIGESKLFSAKTGYNFFHLDEPLSVGAGDYIGFYIQGGEPSRSLPYKNISKGYLLGDVQRLPKDGIIIDASGGYAVSSELVIASLASGSFELKENNSYVLQFPPISNLKGSHISLSLRSIEEPIGSGIVTQPHLEKKALFRYAKPIYK